MLRNLLNWEYWPSYMFYIPNLPYAIYLCLKAKSPVFFSAANPAIKHSGNGTESKFQTLQLFPKAYIPHSIFIKKDTDFKTIEKALALSDLNFPLIVKPDIGFRGLLVKKVNSIVELKAYTNQFHFIDLIVQEYIDLPLECGIFYYRIPNEKSGHITSITLKEYPAIIGDGKSSQKELITQNARLSQHFELLKSLPETNLKEVLPKGEKRILNFIGNHCKGTTFLDGHHFIDADLISAIDDIYQKVPNYYYGRLDLKFESFEKLKNLESFKIIEANGIISEPTHIYDPFTSSYFKALKEIRKHWKLLYKVATVNHTVFKIDYDSWKSFSGSLKDLRIYTKLIAEHSKI